LNDWLQVADSAADTLAVKITELAARHGLRITTDPGELVGYYVVAPDRYNEGVKWNALHQIPGTLAEARETSPGTPGRRIAVMYLLPEGGKA
ncbi:hypothetical protein ACFWPK_34515, partial [Nocardia sp. NPDC058519]|uniref:hypothetical protein n=1 Tax=Nocardia sp. NPDC058519 TaxID=3346535 RepID=UPI00364B456C